MPTIILLLTLYFSFLSNSFFFLSKFFALSFALLFYCPLWCCYAIPYYAWLSPFYTTCHTCHDWIFTILPLNRFCLDVGVLSRPPTSLSTAQPLPPLTCASHATPHSQTKSLILFSCSLCIPIWIRMDIFSYYPQWHASRDSNPSFPFLGGMSSQQDISPKRV